MKKLFYLSLAVLALSACSKENTGDGNDPADQNGETAYMGVSIAMPTVPQVRSIDDGTTKDEGTAGEQKVTSLMVLVYSADGTTISAAETFTAAQLTPANPNDPTILDKTTTYTTPAFKVAKGAKKVVVIVNPLAAEFTETSTLASMRDAMTLTEVQIGTISTDNGFLMTNANTAVNEQANGTPNTDGATVADGDFYMDGSIAVDVQGTKDNPTTVVIPVERAVAKISDVSTTYDLAVTGVTTDHVVFTDIALINGNTKFYPIKKIRTSDASNTNDYVVDPNFTANTDYVNDFYCKTFSTGSTPAPTWTALSTSDRPVIYTLENTMTKDAQMNGYTTGLYYKAQYKRDNTVGHVYKYMGAVYNFDELKTAVAGHVNLGSLTDASPAADFAALGITKYENGICYYPYWIRHVNNNDPDEMGIMEFAVVRNNAYQMTINSVKGIGAPTPENPDPTTPDEDPSTLLQVYVKVLPWTVRANLVDF